MISLRNNINGFKDGLGSFLNNSCFYARRHRQKGFWSNPEVFFCLKIQFFLDGYFESSVSMERSKNNRVQFNITSKYRASDRLNTRPEIPRGKSYAFTGWDK